MFKSNFVTCVVVNGKVMIESDGLVKVPFNTEYSIRLRNKNDRRASAKVFIDDELAGEFIVNAGSFFDLETIPDKHKKFKFVSSKSFEATCVGKNENPTGENGVIRVEWRLERYQPVKSYVPTAPFWEQYTSRRISVDDNNYGSAISCSNVSNGCTVDGGYSNQSFQEVNFNAEVNFVEIRLQLVGVDEVSSYLYCTNCGKKSKNNNENYCSKCGNKLR